MNTNKRKAQGQPRVSLLTKRPKTVTTITQVSRPLVRQNPQQRIGYSSIARTRGAPVTGEMKYFDAELTTATIAAVTTTWVATTMKDPSTTINLGSVGVATPLCLFAPTVGAGLNQRIGRQVKKMKVKINALINVPVQAAQGAVDSSTEIRVMLVMDMQTNSSQMTGAQLMNDAGAPETTINSFQNPNNFGRFRVLKEKRFSISNLNLAGSPTAGDVIQAGIAKPFKMSYKWPDGGCPVHFNATNGGTVADIVDNSMHIVAGVNQAGYAPTIAYYSRVCFKE